MSDGSFNTGIKEKITMMKAQQIKLFFLIAMLLTLPATAESVNSALTARLAQILPEKTLISLQELPLKGFYEAKYEDVSYFISANGNYILDGEMIYLSSDLNAIAALNKARRMLFSTDGISETPIDGLYEATYGMQVYYMTEDGEHIFQGELINLNSKVSLTRSRINTSRKLLLAAEPVEESIVYAATTPETKHVVTVFTDIDCGYCRKLHTQMSEYNNLGIEVRYMWFPRAGINSPSYQKAVSAYCSKDQKKSVTMAKNGQAIEPLSCKNPIAAQYELGQEIGVAGTPYFVTESGELLRGFVKPGDLIARLDK